MGASFKLTPSSINFVAQALALCSSYEVQERNFVSKMRNRRKKSAEEKCIITGVIVDRAS